MIGLFDCDHTWISIHEHWNPQFLVGVKKVIIELKTYREQPLPRMIIFV
jgi:hypothetical protein